MEPDKFFDRRQPAKIDCEDFVKLLAAVGEFIDLSATLGRIETKLDQLLVTTARTDMTAAEEKEVEAKIDHLKKLADKPSA
jgi:hypothetical protein